MFKVSIENEIGVGPSLNLNRLGNYSTDERIGEWIFGVFVTGVIVVNSLEVLNNLLLLFVNKESLDSHALQCNFLSRSIFLS